MAKDVIGDKITIKEQEKINEKSTEKMRVLNEVFDKIKKDFGPGLAMILGDNKIHADVEVFSTGSLSLDRALGINGLPRGRIVEIYGPEASGKTTLALQSIADAHKKGGMCAFIDVEHALDVKYANRLGVDVSKLVLSQPESGEQALEIADTLIRSGTIDILVVDSVAALVPKAELEGEMGDSSMGSQARLMGQALRKLTGSVSKTNTLLIFLNQIRSKIGVMFGNPETTSGGNALKFFSSIRLEIRKSGAIKKGDEIMGYETTVKVIKNKFAPPFKTAKFELLYGEGTNKMGEVVDFGVASGFIKKSGNWLAIGEEKFNGKDALMKALKERKPLYNMCFEAINNLPHITTEVE